jgi:hypothetical protein
MIRSITTRLFRSRILSLVLASATLFTVSLGASTGANPGKKTPPPDLDACQNLTAEAGNKVASHVYATGVQIYRWNGSTWIFDGPEATLFSDAGGQGVVGSHYKGPTWESNSGSKVVGAVVDRCTPDQDSIPWLLLKAVSTEGPGIFHRVTVIQRVNTTGGLEPAYPGDFPGDVEEVPYTAEYYFYRDKN